MRARWAAVGRQIRPTPAVQVDVTDTKAVRRFQKLMRWFLDGATTHLYYKERLVDLNAIADLLFRIVLDLEPAQIPTGTPVPAAVSSSDPAAPTAVEDPVSARGGVTQQLQQAVMRATPASAASLGDDETPPLALPYPSPLAGDVGRGWRAPAAVAGSVAASVASRAAVAASMAAASKAVESTRTCPLPTPRLPRRTQHACRRSGDGASSCCLRRKAKRRRRARVTNGQHARGGCRGRRGSRVWRRRRPWRRRRRRHRRQRL